MSLDASEVQKAFDRTYTELSQRGGIRGFRPGKVPRAVLLRHYEPEAIRAYTLDTVLQERFQEACEGHDLRPLEQPYIKMGPPPDEDEALAEAIKAKAGVAEETPAADQPEAPAEGKETEAEAEQADTAAEDAEEIPLVEGQPFEFHSMFTVFPRPKLPDLSELRLRRPVAEVTDEQIDERLEQIRELRATEVELDRKQVAEGDLVTADILVTLEGEEAGDAEPQEQEFVIGQRRYDPPIDRAMIDHEVGETVEVPVAYPDDHPDEALAGKKGVLRATITSVRGRELPELDDEFAQSLGDYRTLAELRAQLRESLEKGNAEYAQEALRGQVMEFIAMNSEVDLPEEVMDSVTQHGFESLMRDLERSGMSVEEFAEVAGTDEEGLRARERSRAATGMTLYLALGKLIEQRGIEVEEADLRHEMQRVALESGADLETVFQAAQIQPGFAEEMRKRAERTKLLDTIIAEAQVEDVPRELFDREETEGAEAPQAEEEPAAAADEQEAEKQ